MLKMASIRPQRHAVSLLVGSGEEVVEPFGRARNLSVTGVFLETELRPPIDTERTIAIVWGDETVTCRVRVVRYEDDGVAVTFVDPDPYFSSVVGEILASSPPIAVAASFR